MPDVHTHGPDQGAGLDCREHRDESGQLRGACQAPTDKRSDESAAGVDVVDVFHQLVREVDAGRALLAMTEPGRRRRAAADALALCRDVLTDARDLFGRCACGAVELAGDDTAQVDELTNLAHHGIACVALDRDGAQL